MSEDAGPVEPVLVGRVVKPRGVRGEVVVEPTGSSVGHLTPGRRLWAGDRYLTVESRRSHGHRHLVHFAGVGDYDAAEALRGRELEIDADELEELEEGSYYVDDLLGCRVEAPDGTELGVVTEVLHGNGDSLEVDRGDGTFLVPLARPMVRAVDAGSGCIVVDLPEGLQEATHSSPRRGGGGRTREDAR